MALVKARVPESLRSKVAEMATRHSAGAPDQVQRVAKPEVVAEQAQRDELPDSLKQLLNFVFKQLMAMKPAWRSGFKSREEAAAYKAQLGLAMRDGGITSMKQVEAALKQARLDDSPFMPSTGQFVEWAKATSEPQSVFRAKELPSKSWEQMKREGRAQLASIREQMRKRHGGVA